LRAVGISTSRSRSRPPQDRAY